jgi:hypothetical protein
MDYSYENILEMSLYDLRAQEFTKTVKFTLFLSLPTLLAFSHVGFYLTSLLLFIWALVVLLCIFVFKRIIPRLDYLKQLKRRINEIIALQQRNYLKLDIIKIKDLLKSANYTEMEIKYKLLYAQSNTKPYEDKMIETKKISILLANHLISPDVIVIKTNDKFANYPLCIQYNISENNIKNYSNTLKIVSKLKTNSEKVNISPEKNEEIYSYMNQLESIYKNGLQDVAFIKKRLDSME